MEETTVSPELEAISKVSKQVEQFKQQLGERVGKEEFAKAEKLLSELKEGLNKWEEKKIDSALDTINTSISKFGTRMEEMQEELNQAKEGEKGRKKTDFVDTKDIQAFIDATFKDNKKTVEAASIKLNGAGHVFKAAETFGLPSFFEGADGTVTDAFTGRMVDPVLYQSKRKRNLILDNFRIESITVPKLIYLIKKEVSGDDGGDTDTGGADWILSGESKPKRSFRVTTGSSEAKKVAIFSTVEDKLLRDVASFENWLRDDLITEIKEKYNDGVLNNNPAVNEKGPLGLKNNAVQFAATSSFNGTISDANEIDMIVAAIAYMASKKEQAAQVFIASEMYYKILVLKGSDGHYLNKDKVYVSPAGQIFIAGVPLIPCDVEDVPATHLLMTGVDLGFKIKNYGPLIFERGLNGTDFQEDKTSYRAYQECITYIPEHREYSVLYDEFSNILAGIQATGA